MALDDFPHHLFMTKEEQAAEMKAAILREAVALLESRNADPEHVERVHELVEDLYRSLLAIAQILDYYPDPE